jgi:hypothetical protein
LHTLKVCAAPATCALGSCKPSTDKKLVQVLRDNIATEWRKSGKTSLSRKAICETYWKLFYEADRRRVPH